MVVVLTGGNDGSSWNSGAHDEVEILGSCPGAAPPALPYARRAHVTALTADNLLLTCGGDADYSCVFLKSGDYLLPG